MTHDELQDDLATHLRGNTDRMVWCNLQMGPSGSARPDVFTVARSFAKFQADVYEIKISVADLRKDTTSGKWQKYLQFAHRVWFAFPAGLVPHEEVPRQCGIMVRHDKIWRPARKPVSQHLASLPHDAWLKLLMDGTTTPGHIEPRSASTWMLMREKRIEVAAELAELFNRREDARDRYAAATKRLEDQAAELVAERERRASRARENEEREARRLDAALQSLAEVLGCPPTAASLRSAIIDLSYSLAPHHFDNAIKHLNEIKTALARVDQDEQAPSAQEVSA